jgi:hypothetical protein
MCIHFDRVLTWFFYVLWERRVSSFVHLADGSPELIHRDTALGYAGIWAPEQQVCLENPEVKTMCVTARPGGSIRWRPPLNGFFSSYWILPSALTMILSRQIAGLVTYRHKRSNRSR